MESAKDKLPDEELNSEFIDEMQKKQKEKTVSVEDLDKHFREEE